MVAIMVNGGNTTINLHGGALQVDPRTDAVVVTLGISGRRIGVCAVAPTSKGAGDGTQGPRYLGPLGWAPLASIGHVFMPPVAMC